MRCIVLLNVDDPDNTSIAQDKNGDNWVLTITTMLMTGVHATLAEHG